MSQGGEANEVSQANRSRIVIAMAIGAVVAAGLLIVGPVLSWLPYLSESVSERGQAAAVSLAVLGLFLVIAIGRVARHRFFSDRDIDPTVGEASQMLQDLQKQLQNTLEQVVLALAAYLAWIASVPCAWGNAPIVAAAIFALGRLLFFAGYSRGPSARALGFTLTFYPSIAVLIGAIAAIAIDFAG